MDTPSVPGDGTGKVNGDSAGTGGFARNAGRAATAAGNTAKAGAASKPDAAGKAAKAGAGAAQKTGGSAARGAEAAKRTAQGTAREAAQGAKGAARGTAHGVRKGAAQAGGQVAALPGRVAGLARLMTPGRLLRAVPVAAAGVAGVVVGRLTARKR